MLSMIMTSLHDFLHTQLKLSFVLNLKKITEIVHSQKQKNHVNQHHLSVSISAAQVNVISEHNIFDKKRKLNQNKLNKMNTVDDNKNENFLFYVYR